MNHKELDVWNVSIQLVEDIYRHTLDFPKEERFGLNQQMRRAAVSIPSNIAEGSARKYRKELIQFLYIANGSSSELDTQLIIAHKLKYLNDKGFETLQMMNTRVRVMLVRLIQSLSA